MWWESPGVYTKTSGNSVLEMYSYSNVDKNNKESPLFYNENGLSPFELLKIGERKFEEN